MALPMLTRIKAQNLLSFGPEGIDLELPALTVLIGPNGSGKSNLLETVGLLRGAPSDLTSPIREGGGVTDWIWKGIKNQLPRASVETTLTVGPHPTELSHLLQFVSVNQQFFVAKETIQAPAINADAASRPVVWQHALGKVSRITRNGDVEEETEERFVDFDKSVLSEVKDPVQFPELSRIANFYQGISLYRQWEFGSKAAIRQPQRTDVRPTPLMENFSNLGMFLNRLRQYPAPKRALFEKLGDIYSGVSDFELNFEGGTVQVFFTEGEFAMPATRLSDGSLRYLCLLAILLDPEPPSLVCIEEPELGFHPDLIPKLADLLVDASSRCQVIVTTHSDILVDALSDRPESVVVCEKHDGQTSMRRLDRSDLAVWLEKYRLGELWTRGDLGGVRW